MKPSEDDKMLVASRISHHVVAILLLVVAASSGYGQSSRTQTQDSPVCNQQCVEAVRAWIDLPYFRADYQERENREMGDRIAIAIRKIYSEADLQDAENVRSVFPVIRAAFEKSESLDASVRKPVRTIALLKEIRGKLTGRFIIMDIDQLIFGLKAGIVRTCSESAIDDE